MHQPIRENLEDYLNGPAEKIPQEFHAHLAVCQECAGELGLLEAQASQLRMLRPAESVEPRPGFYARVRERIEAQERASIWSVFLEPRFGRRLAVASGVLALLLGGYLVSSELADPEIAVAPTVAVGSPAAGPIAVAEDTPQQQQQRDAVLVDLASYHE